MSMSVGSLIEFSTDVLQGVLDGMRGRLDGLQDRIAELEQDRTDTLDESAVEDLIDQALDRKDYAESSDILDRQDVENIIADQGFLTSGEAYDAVSNQVYDMVKDVVREDLDEKDFADRDHDHDGTYATAESYDDLVERIEALEADRSEHLRLIQDLQESSSGATRFFKLAVQMLDIVRESVGR